MLHRLDHCYLVQYGPKVYSDIKSIDPDLPIYSGFKYFPSLKAANKFISFLQPSDRFYLNVTLTIHYEYKEDFKL